jgi:NitT/TauT family transport system substrate-binding protein
MQRLIVAAIVFLAVGCAPAAPGPTPAPAKPAATAAPAKPTEAPAGKPAEAKPAASPAPKAEAKPADAKPAASPAAKVEAKPAGKPEDIRVPRPAGNLAFKMGFNSEYGFGDVPILITVDRLNTDGWKIEKVVFSSSELGTEATAKNEVQWGSGATSSSLLAVQKGAKLPLIVEKVANHWVVVSKPGLQKCEDLNGKGLAIHSEGAVSTAMVRTWVDTACKGKPNYLVISGSQNRAAALINGQIDATPLELVDWVNIETLHPGKFRLLVDFAQGLPDLSTTPVIANGDFLARNREAGVAFVAELLKTHRMADADPSILVKGAIDHKLELDQQSLPAIVEAYRKLDGFYLNGGMTAKKVEGSIKFYTESRVLQPGLSVEQGADLSVVEDALKLIGRVPGRL